MYKVVSLGHVERMLNNKILGSEVNIAQYRLPIEKTGDRTRHIGIVNMENYQMCKVINNLDMLIDLSIPDGTERKNRWKESVRNYTELMKIMRKK